MKVSRAPEHRSGTNKTFLFSLVVISVIVVGALVVYMTAGFGPSTAVGAQSTVPVAVPEPVVPAKTVFAALPALPTRVPAAVPTPAPAKPTAVPDVEIPTGPGFVPGVKFGEVLSEGFVRLDLPSRKGVDSWYTYQVDTASREITLFFAIYNEDLDELVRTVKVEQYSQAEVISNAEITVFYQDDPNRVLKFDRSQGLMTIKQPFARPAGPSLFSPDLRVALVDYGITLQDATGTIQTQLQLDVSGLSDAEGMVFRRTTPELVDSVLGELQLLVDQIESLRIK